MRKSGPRLWRHPVPCCSAPHPRSVAYSSAPRINNAVTLTLADCSFATVDKCEISVENSLSHACRANIGRRKRDHLSMRRTYAGAFFRNWQKIAVHPNRDDNAVSGWLALLGAGL